MTGESVGESLGILNAPINPNGPAVERVEPNLIDRYKDDWRPSTVEVDAAEVTLVEALDEGIGSHAPDGYYRPLGEAILINARRAKLILADAAKPTERRATYNGEVER